LCWLVDLREYPVQWKILCVYLVNAPAGIVAAGSLKTFGVSHSPASGLLAPWLVDGTFNFDGTVSIGSVTGTVNTKAKVVSGTVSLSVAFSTALVANPSATLL
jgi:hypothetical protein